MMLGDEQKFSNCVHAHTHTNLFHDKKEKVLKSHTRLVVKDIFLGFDTK